MLESVSRLSEGSVLVEAWTIFASRAATSAQRRTRSLIVALPVICLLNGNKFFFFGKFADVLLLLFPFLKYSRVSYQLLT